MTPGSRPEIVLYDGVCGLCNGLVRFALPRDRAGVFRFAALQGRAAGEILSRHGMDPRDLDTVYVAVPDERGGERLLRKSRAVLHMLSRLGPPWSLSALVAPLPTRLLDALYDVVARNRYRVFGRSETCLLPAPEWRDRFMDG
jgi:predicted DCC family thiol-disulfide oxidoreductase YuxK